MGSRLAVKYIKSSWLRLDGRGRPDGTACNPAFARQKQVDNENQSSWVYVASFKSAKVTERDPV